MTADDARAMPDAVPGREAESPPTVSTPRRPITPGEAHQATGLIARAMTVEASKLYALLVKRS